MGDRKPQRCLGQLMTLRKIVHMDIDDAFLAPLPRLTSPGVGKATEKHLENIGIRTSTWRVEDITAAVGSRLRSRLTSAPNHGLEPPRQ